MTENPNCEKAVVVRFTDGLGNQLFQYAFARMQSLRSNLPLLYDLGWYRDGPGRERQDRPFLLHNYRIDARECSTNESKHFVPSSRWLSGGFLSRCNVVNSWWRGRKIISESAEDVIASRNSLHEAWMQPLGSAFLQGYFASHQYADSIRNDLLQELQVKDEIPQDLLLQQQHLSGQESVAVCFRRGDYVNIPALGLVPNKYYEQSISLMRTRLPNAKFYVFSDDPGEAYSALEKFGIEDAQWTNAKRPAYHKLALLKSCRHFILANSTFGWWAAWLGKNQESIIVRPEIWFQGSGESYLNIFPPDWISL